MDAKLTEQIEAADRIRRDAEFEYDRETAILIRKLGGTTIWQRALKGGGR